MDVLAGAETCLQGRGTKHIAAAATARQTHARDLCGLSGATWGLRNNESPTWSRLRHPCHVAQGETTTCNPSKPGQKAKINHLRQPTPDAALPSEETERGSACTLTLELASTTSDFGNFAASHRHAGWQLQKATGPTLKWHSSLALHRRKLTFEEVRVSRMALVLLLREPPRERRAFSAAPDRLFGSWALSIAGTCKQALHVALSSTAHMTQHDTHDKAGLGSQPTRKTEQAVRYNQHKT